MSYESTINGIKRPELNNSNILVEYNNTTIEFQLAKTLNLRSYVGSLVLKLETGFIIDLLLIKVWRV